MKNLLIIIFGILPLLTFGQLPEKIDYYVEDITTGRWAIKFNNAINWYTGSTDTINPRGHVNETAYYKWDILVNGFIDSVPCICDTINSVIDNIENKRLAFNTAVDSMYAYFDELLLDSLVLKLQASSISEDSLTYNSSGDLVTAFSNDTVVLDGSSEVVIGNSVRFGIATTGTIYQVLDTLTTSDSLILNQTFTGSVTDEFFWGGVNTWYDESGVGNNAYQTTAIYQPKLLWAGNDSSEVRFDGINDLLNIDNQFNPNTGYCWHFKYTPLTNDDNQRIFSNSRATVGYEIYNDISRLSVRTYSPTTDNFLSDGNTIFPNNEYSVVINKSSNDFTCYIDGNEQLTTTINITDQTTVKSYISGLDLNPNPGIFKQKLKEFTIYNRALTENEIQILSQ
jgi:hypothetical protein